MGLTLENNSRREKPDFLKGFPPKGTPRRTSLEKKIKASKALQQGTPLLKKQLDKTRKQLSWKQLHSNRKDMDRQRRLRTRSSSKLKPSGQKIPKGFKPAP